MEFKKTARQLMKSTSQWYFKITECKWILIKRCGLKNIFVTGEPVYKHSIGCYKTIVKKNADLQNLNSDIIEKHLHQVKIEKIHVNKLLTKHFVDKLEENTDLLYYKNLFLMHNRENWENKEEEQTNEKENVCEGLSDIPDFFV